MKGFSLETDATFFARSGYLGMDIKRFNCLWNASVAYAIGKHWALRAIAYDMLDNLNSTERVVTSYSWKETVRTTLPQYVMFSIGYKF